MQAGGSGEVWPGDAGLGIEESGRRAESGEMQDSMNGAGDAEAGKRQRQVLRASCVSIAGNAVLSVAKIVVFISGSFAVVSDGIDSASDVAISIVMIVTAKIMGRKPNKKYVYGYAKAESIATKLLSMLIFFAGAEMLISAVQFRRCSICFQKRQG